MRCTLRPYAASDLDSFLTLLSDTEVVRWIGDGQLHLDGNRRWFARVLVLETGPAQRFAFLLAVWQDHARARTDALCRGGRRQLAGAQSAKIGVISLRQKSNGLLASSAPTAQPKLMALGADHTVLSNCAAFQQ